MNKNPEAIFDSLYLSKTLQENLGDFARSEIHLFSYLACLLSLYDGHPISFWGYSYIKNEYGSPFSFEIEEAIKTSESQRFLSKNDDKYLIITESGLEILNHLTNHAVFSDRLLYLNVAITSITLLPFGMVKESVSNEPVLNSAQNHDKRRNLIDENNVAMNLLYDHFRILKLALSDKYNDITVPALVWINKLFESRKNHNPYVH